MSDREGSAQFYAEEGCGETTELTTRNISNVDVLKIDAEGNDFFVMLGAESYIAASRISMSQFEYNSPWMAAGATLTRAFDFLKSHGYKVRLLRGPALYDLDVKITGEFFAYSNFIAYCPSLVGDILDRLPCRPAL